MASTLNKKLSEWLRGDNGNFNSIDYMGLEVELEHEAILGAPRNPKLWNIVPDASLRNGFEMTTKPGFKIGDIDKYLLEFEGYTKNFKLTHSIRTSIHTHVNAICLTLNEIYAVLATFWLLEDYLVDMNGPDRKGNLHCLRLADADNLRDRVLEEIKQQKFFQTWRNEDRYAAQNLHSLSKFGTIEYRFIRGLHETDLIKQWAENLHKMVYEASRLGTVKNVLDMLETRNISAFIDNFFFHDFANIVKKTAFESASVDNNYHFIYEINKSLENVSKVKLRFNADDDLEGQKKLDSVTQKKVKFRGRGWAGWDDPLEVGRGYDLRRLDDIVPDEEPEPAP